MQSLIDEIKSLSEKIETELIGYRRHLHKHPELSKQEVETANFISSVLSKWKIEHRCNIGGYGIVGEIKGVNPESKTVALRADMDALPINEKNDVDYVSVNSGVMHACGHDVHMTCLLGAIFILDNFKDRFTGTVRFIFQPSEESFPGGAKAMIEEGVLTNPTPKFIIGEHVLPELEVGKVGFVSGKAMASTDEIYLTVKGKGGHGALPNLSTDTVLTASHIVVALQQIVSRCAPPTIPTVLSFGRFIAEGRTNVLPDIVKIDGTLRTFDEKWRAEALEKITHIAKHTAVAMGAECEVFIDEGYPYVLNDKEVTQNLKKAAVSYFGKSNVVDLEPRMTAEDFAFYSHVVPACFYRLGVKNPDWKEIRNVHSPVFDIDERAIANGAGFMAYATMQGL
ncbi:MAG: M20 family metallopeptidase [Bacteroidales bacterium]